MTFLQTLRLAARALRRNTLRSILTALGIIIGVAAVIALVGIGDGARERIESQIAELGENLLLILPGSFGSGGVRSGWGGRASLKPADAIAIAREVPFVVSVSPEVRTRSQVLANGQNWYTTVLGESADYATLRNWTIAEGSMFDPDDVTRLAKVAIVGQTIVDMLFPDGSDPLGKIIRIRNAPFRIVGVLGAKGFNLNGQDQDDLVIVPYSSHLRRIARRDFVDTILVQVTDASRFATVEQQISDLLTARHRLQGDEEPDFTMRNQLDIVQRATAATRTMTLLLGAIAGVSLVVGGIGIMNIMLVSVTERTREIGIRIAIGAHDDDVLRQFLLEAVLISSGGGVIGVVTGIGTSQLLAHLNDWPIAVSPAAAVVAVAFSAAVGIFFGYYPARRAAQMDPIHALKFE